MATLHLAMFHMHLTAYPQVAFSSGGRRDTGLDHAYSLDPVDYPRLPLFKLKGAKGSTAFLNAVFWLVFDSVGT